MYEKLAKILYDLFVVNHYAAAIQQKDGRYLTKYFEVSPLVIENVLYNKGCIGCYQQLYKSKYLKWICFDFDCTNKNNPDIYSLNEKCIKPFVSILKNLDINFLTEFSGRRGIHVWIIFNEFIDKSLAFEIVSIIMRKASFLRTNSEDIEIDLFPSTPISMGNKLGKQVKLPLSCHRKGGRSYFYIDDLDKDYYEEDFFNNQTKILEAYKLNNIDGVVDKLDINKKDYYSNNKFEKCKLIDNLECSIDDVVTILSKTKVYREIVSRMINGKALSKDWFVMLGTLGVIDSECELLIEFYKYSPNFDIEVTKQKIKLLKDKYSPATFRYLYQIYGLEIEEYIDEDITGLEYLLKELGKEDILEKIIINNSNFTNNEKSLINRIDITLNKEINYLLYNDEVVSVSIYNELRKLKKYDLMQIEETIEKIKSEKRIKLGKKEWVKYIRNETDDKQRILVSLGAYDRILTTHLINILAYNIKFTSKSYSYNLNFISVDDIFFHWYTSWGNFIEQISNYLEIEYMGNYNIMVLDIKGFYDNVDFLSIYESLLGTLDDENRNIFKFLIQYNSELMREINKEKQSRIGVPQGPAYARVVAEMYLTFIFKKIEKNCIEAVPGHYKLFRYVDDIVIIYDDYIKGDSLYNEIVELLNINGLYINQMKSRVYGKIKTLRERERNEILRKDKFNYDLKNSEVSYLLNDEEIYEKTINYINKKEHFDIADVNYIFNKYINRKSIEIYLKRYASNIFSSELGRGSSFIRFYRYILSDAVKVKEYLEFEYFDLIPINSINFKNFINQLYLMIQDEEINMCNVKMIIDYYLKHIDLDIIDNEDDKTTVKALIEYGGNLYYELLKQNR